MQPSQAKGMAVRDVKCEIGGFSFTRTFAHQSIKLAGDL